MENGRPTKTDPIASDETPQKLETILLRFAVLLTVAIVILAIVWSR